MRSSSKNLIQAAALGAIAGSRTTAAPFIINRMLKRSGSPLGWFKWLRSRPAVFILSALAGGELIADKLPNTPARIKAGGLIGRGLAGALTGAAIFKANGNPTYIGALTGAAAAVASSFGCYFLRMKVDELTEIPDAVVGTAEDLLVGAGGVLLVMTA